MAEKFVAREKMGKKARRVLDAQKRRTWDCSPVPKILESRKKYNRNRDKLRCRIPSGDGVFYFEKFR